MPHDTHSTETASFTWNVDSRCRWRKCDATSKKYGLLDDQVEFVKGWFCETLPKLAGHTWSTIRLDGDMYQSTFEALVNLYPGLSPGGYIIIDDFGAVPACRQAVLDFRQNNCINEEIRQIDWTGVYWQRESAKR